MTDRFAGVNFSASLAESGWGLLEVLDLYWTGFEVKVDWMTGFDL